MPRRDVIVRFAYPTNGYRDYVRISEEDVLDVIAMLRKDVEQMRRRSKHFRELTGGTRGDANAVRMWARRRLANKLADLLEFDSKGERG